MSGRAREQREHRELRPLTGRYSCLSLFSPKSRGGSWTTLDIVRREGMCTPDGVRGWLVVLATTSDTT